jgi:flagellar hook-length control protein FliK
VADPAPTPALPTQPASTVPELNWDHLVASIHLKQKTSQKTLTIQLRPDSYGKLQIRLEHSEQGLMTHLITDNAQTSVLLGSHVRHLQDLLAAKGFVCPQIEVSCQPQTLANDHSGQHPGHSPPQDHRPAPDVLPVKTARSPENLADRRYQGLPAIQRSAFWTAGLEPKGATMANSSLSSLTSATGSTASSMTGLTAKKTLDQEAFLQILVTELENQDPMQPLEDKEFITQLAQFSTLEQMQTLNQTAWRHRRLRSSAG